MDDWWRHQRRCHPSKLESANITCFTNEPVTIDELCTSETEITRLVQIPKDEMKFLKYIRMGQHICNRVKARKRNVSVKRNSSLYRLIQFLDNEGSIRVGGSMRRAALYKCQAHSNPPKETSLYWTCHSPFSPTNCTSISRNDHQLDSIQWLLDHWMQFNCYISKCIDWMREDSLTPVPPFTYCGFDFFGSLHTKEGRKAIKRRWVFFTCMASIVIHQ